MKSSSRVSTTSHAAEENTSIIDPDTLDSNPWAPEDARRLLADQKTQVNSVESPPGRKRRHLHEEVASMHTQKRFRDELGDNDSWYEFDSSGGITSAGLHHIEVHRVNCVVHDEHETAMYTDRPRLFKGDNKVAALRGRHPISEDIFGDEFSLENPFVSFAVVKEYDCGQYYEKQIPRNAFQTIDMPRNIAKTLTSFKSHLSFLEDSGPEAIPSTERIYPIAQELKKTIADLEALYPHSLGLSGHNLDQKRQGIGLMPPHVGIAGGNRNSALTAPYLGIYHMRSLLKDNTKQRLRVAKDQKRYSEHLVDYVLEAFAHEYKEADEQFARGLVTKRHFPKLFALEDVIIQTTNEGPVGFVVSKILSSQEHNVVMECWNLDFDGQVYKRRVQIQVSWQSKEEQMLISSLAFFPLMFADEASRSRLWKRGEQFWQCRKRRLIECDSLTTNFEFQTTSNRYMVDIETYKQMHPESINSREESDVINVDDEKLPEGNFLYVLPSTIRGYGFHDKKWSSIPVEIIRDVTWNSDTFDRRLVLKPHKKELIKALITVHNSPPDRPRKSDIIEGKGKGLIILLHGGPGTGKTLTAESIAEYARCPLYRVTCGDIGTDPESVEKYLETVLYIGTVWRCVVLLDEADVFLEERTPTDLQRNALVSVFLRTLEYFEGILVLTSNRVGTFDEAFKSRVQLAIHYPPLDSKGRYKIWHMFFRDMLSSDERTKQDELEDQLKTLSQEAMNGRQIRNVINTARQLARYRKEALAYSHIDQALDVAREFEQYVTATRGHTDEEFARADRIR